MSPSTCTIEQAIADDADFNLVGHLEDLPPTVSSFLARFATM